MPRFSPMSRLMARAQAAGIEPALAAFLQSSISRAQRTTAMQQALAGPFGTQLRSELGQWIADVLADLVPRDSANWRLLVQDAMRYVVEHLSDARLAPKLVEQLELPTRATPERRLLLLVERVPGLQKLGQVLARNQSLEPPLRRALSLLENGIRDMNTDEVRAIVLLQLKNSVAGHDVRLARKLRSEATVSAVLPFSWTNPETRRRERGVFKVLKPHIPGYFHEDLQLLQGLAEFLRRNARTYGVGARGVADMFREVRRLLKHETGFRGEQRRLSQAALTYGQMNGVRVPKLIAPLCTGIVTAMSDESGVKITRAMRTKNPRQRRRVAEQLIEALIATPLFAPAGDAMFHADPHAGNLMFDKSTGDIVLLDWALAGTLTLEQRRHLLRLFGMVMLRDRIGIAEAVQALELPGRRIGRSHQRALRSSIERFIDELPVGRVPDSMDAMRLLQRLAFDGLRLPGSLILLRKVMFTLEAIVYEIVGGEVAMDKILVRSLFWKWFTRRLAMGAPLNGSDWLRLHTSVLLSGSRWCIQAAQAMVNRGAAATAA